MRKGIVALLLGALLLTATPAAGQGGWVELIRSPSVPPNTDVAWGRWRFVTTWDGYDDCWSSSVCPWAPYHPGSGPDGGWWQVGYNDAAWPTVGRATWDASWAAFPPLPAIGTTMMTANGSNQGGTTDLHRVWFTLSAGYAVGSAELLTVSDNHSQWYVNGSTVDVHKDGRYTAPVSPALLTPGSNLLAVQLANDNVCFFCNPHGLQYQLRAFMTPLAPGSLDVGVGCAGGSDRTVGWTEANAIFETELQAARDPSFTVDLRSAGWVSGNTATLTGLTDGLWYYRARSRDTGGITGSWTAVVSAIQDLTPPASTATLSGTLGNGGWYRSPVHVTLAALELGCGFQETTYQVDGGGWQPYAAPLVLATDGSHAVDYRSADVVGNVEATQTLPVAIDTRPPTTTIAISGTLGQNGWFTSTVAVGLSAVDATSGVASSYLDGTPLSGTMVIAADGMHALPYYSMDVAGNVEAALTATLKLDTTPPQAGVTGGTFCATCGQALPIGLSAADATSGLASWQLTIPALGRTWLGSGAPPAIVPWDGQTSAGQVTAPGSYALNLQVTDNAGWVARASGQAHVTSPPPPPPPPPVPAASTATPTATPTPTSTPASTFTPTSTTTPPPPPPTRPPAAPPTFTPIPVAVAPPPVPAITLRGLIFQDDDADAHRTPVEPGLGGLSVRVQGPGNWSSILVANARGVITLTLPAPGTYTVWLATWPGANWERTTRTLLTITVQDSGEISIVAPDDEGLPIGFAPDATFAIGLLARRLTIWLPLAGAALLIPVSLCAVLDRRAQAIRDLGQVLYCNHPGGNR